MTSFEYTVKSSSGSLSTGLLEALSPADARKQLLEQGLFTIALKEVRSAPAAASQWIPRRNNKRVRKSDLLIVTCQLSVMAKSGIDLAEAIKGIAQNSVHPGIRELFQSIFEDVHSGSALSAALNKHSKIFGDSYVSAVAAAEASGTLTETFIRLADLLRNEVRLRGAVAATLAYPAALLLVAQFVVAALVFFVLPQFAQVFQDLAAPPPPMTRLLLDVATWIRGNLLLVLLLIGGGVAAVGYAIRHPLVVGAWHVFQLRNVIVARAARPLLAGKTFRLLATMLQSDVPLLEAIRLTARSTRNVLYVDLFRVLEREVANGRGMSSTLEQAAFLPAGAAQMIRTAECSGRLAEVLETVGAFYEEDGERELKQIVKLMEPGIVVLMGAVVAGVVGAVILPLLDISSMSG